MKEGIMVMNECFCSAVLDIVSPVEVASGLLMIFLIPILLIVLIAIIIVFAIILRRNARRRNESTVLGKDTVPASPNQAEDTKDEQEPTEDELN